MSKGFTLIETMIAITIFVLAMGGVAIAVVGVYGSQRQNRRQAVAIEEARRGIKTMVKEIREAQPREGGSYPIEKAGSEEIIFYSDVDQDLEVEKVRYYLGRVGSGSETETCYSDEEGGSCQVTFSDFLSGSLSDVSLEVSAEGDLNLSSGSWWPEYLNVSSGGWSGQICEGQSECNQCIGHWEDNTVYESEELFNLVKNSMEDSNQVTFTADASEDVGVESGCDWEVGPHSFRIKFDLNWTEELPSEGNLKKTVTDPVGSDYSGTTTTKTISSYVSDSSPIFRYYYFNEEENELKEIEDKPARLKDTELIEVSLTIDEDPDQDPKAFQLSSCAQLRNSR